MSTPALQGLTPSQPHLNGSQALELGAAEVLLLEGRRVQHQVLLLRGVHLLQILRRGAGRPMQRLLNYLR